MLLLFGAKKKKNTKKILPVSGTCISGTARAISFRFGMYGTVYEDIKYVELVEIQCRCHSF